MWMRGGAIALALVGLAACGGADGETASSAGGLGDRLQTAAQGLCDALGLANDGDVPGASEAFENRSHAFLHELADRLGRTDRAAAAELLEAKQVVEAALADPSTDAAEVADVIDRLRGELGRAAEAAELPSPSCEEAA